MNPVFLTLLLLLLNSCSIAPERHPPQKADQRDIHKFTQAQRLYQSGQTKRAIQILKSIVQKNPSSAITDNALLLLGDIFMSNKKFSLALNAYKQIYSGATFSPLDNKSKIKAAQCLAHLQRHKEGLYLLKTVIHNKTATKKERQLARNIQLQFFKKIQSPLLELQTLVDLYSETRKESLKIRAFNIVDHSLSKSQLETVSKNSKFSFVRPLALFHLGLSDFEKSHFDVAKKYLKKVLSLSPNSEIAERSQELIQQINAHKFVNHKTIGAILPLSGPLKKIGYKTLMGLQLGMGIYGPHKSNLKLAVIDSESDPAVARRAVERLVFEDHVIALVGSLSSKAATSVAAKAQKLRVPIITLSQKAKITHIGDYVFRNSLTSEMQVKKLVETAINEAGIQRFAILYPNDSYGKEFARLFWEIVEAMGGDIRGAQAYAPKETDFRVSIQKLVGTYFKDDRKKEYSMRVKDWKNQQIRLTSRNDIPKDLLPPVIDFEAIFIPDRAKIIGQIAPMLLYNDVDNVTLIGTNLWNTLNLKKRTGKALNQPLFVDSFLSTDSFFQNSLFFKNFRKTFKESPADFEVQAYDVGIIIRSLLSSGATSRKDFKNKLSRITSIDGAIGPLTMNQNREVIRPMVTLTLNNGKIQRYFPKERE